MSNTSDATTPAVDLLKILFGHPFRLLVPAVAVAAALTVYALNRSDTWEASQAVVIRNEAATSLDGPGKFRYRDQMKTIEETILEVAASRDVLQRTLAQVGPPEDAVETDGWPNTKAIAQFRKQFQVKPPNGTEYGNTEVIYLRVRNEDRERAIALVEAAYHQLRRGLGEVREDRAESMIAELQQAATLAQAALDDVTRRLGKTEQSVGSDLADLRTLDHSSGGGGQLARQLADIQTERRQLSESSSEKKDFLELLHAASKDPQILIAAPNDWLESQPMLLQLREGLIETQLRTAMLLGRLTEKYPSVKAARREVEAIRKDIFRELAVAARGVRAELAAIEGRAAILLEKEDEICQRLDRLAALRASYSNLSEQVVHRRTLLEDAERDLTEAQASRAAAQTSSLLSRIGTPEIGMDPVGPSRASIILAGIACGFMTGLGLVLLTAPKLPPAGATSANRAKHSQLADQPAPRLAHEGNGNGTPRDHRPAAQPRNTRGKPRRRPEQIQVA